MNTIACPACHRLLVFPAEATAQKMQCPGCRSIFMPGSSQPLDTRFRAEQSAVSEHVTDDDNRSRDYGPENTPWSRRPSHAPSGSFAIGRVEKAWFWTGFILGSLTELTLNSQSIGLRIFMAPVFGAIVGFLLISIRIYLRHTERLTKFILALSFVVATGGLMAVMLLNMRERSVENVLLVVTASLVMGGVVSIGSCFIITSFLQVANVPKLLAFAAEPDNPGKSPIHSTKSPQRN